MGLEYIRMVANKTIKRYHSRWVVLLLVINCMMPAGCSSSGAATELVLPTSLPEISPTITDQVTPSPTPTSRATREPTTIPTPRPVPRAGEDSIGDPYTPELGNTGYDVQAYTLQLVLDPANTQLSGKVLIDARIDASAINRLSLDFAGFTITNLVVNQMTADYERDHAKLWINLPSPAYQGDVISIEISYQGTPLIEPSPYVPFIGHVGLYYPGNTIFTLSEPNGAHYWFPSNNHLKDKAIFNISITVPDRYTAVANGSLIDSQTADPGWMTYRWEHPYPMAPYLAVVAVGDYERIEDQSPGGIPLRYYIYPDLMEEFSAATANLGEALDWMVEVYGPYPFESFGFVTSRLVSLASETQTMVILPETSLNEETVIHELAHMWFGDWVSLESWADMWLKEGLAIYSYLMWQTRNQPSDLDYFMQERTERLFSEPSGYPLNNLPKSQLLGTDTYWKGAAVIHALRKEIGDENFFTGLRLLVERFGGKNISLPEFQELMEEVSGKSLTAFFERWLTIE